GWAATHAESKRHGKSEISIAPLALFQTSCSTNSVSSERPRRMQSEFNGFSAMASTRSSIPYRVESGWSKTITACSSRRHAGRRSWKPHRPTVDGAVLHVVIGKENASNLDGDER